RSTRRPAICLSFMPPRTSCLAFQTGPIHQTSAAHLCPNPWAGTESNTKKPAHPKRRSRGHMRQPGCLFASYEVPGSLKDPQLSVPRSHEAWLCPNLMKLQTFDHEAAIIVLT